MLILGLFFCGRNLFAQNHPEQVKNLIDSVNRLIDRAVVEKDSLLMKKYYADDFFFLHSTGMIDSKKSWIKSALSSKTGYASRKHDSVIIELHPRACRCKRTINRSPETGKWEVTLSFALPPDLCPA